MGNWRIGVTTVGLALLAALVAAPSAFAGTPSNGASSNGASSNGASSNGAHGLAAAKPAVDQSCGTWNPYGFKVWEGPSFEETFSPHDTVITGADFLLGFVKRTVDEPVTVNLNVVSTAAASTTDNEAGVRVVADDPNPLATTTVNVSDANGAGAKWIHVDFPSPVSVPPGLSTADATLGLQLTRTAPAKDFGWVVCIGQYKGGQGYGGTSFATSTNNYRALPADVSLGDTFAFKIWGES